jgi:hypothetical protein
VLLYHVESNIFNFCGCLTKRERRERREKRGRMRRIYYKPTGKLTETQRAWASDQAEILEFFAIGGMVYHGNGFSIVDKKMVAMKIARPGLYSIPQTFCGHCSGLFKLGKPLPDQPGEDCVVPQLCPKKLRRRTPGALDRTNFP